MLATVSRLATAPAISSSVATRALLPCVSTIPGALSAAAVARRFVASATKDKENVIIMGAAGRDFHDFITYWSMAPRTEVKCFTATQIPGIDHRVFPPEMCNNDKNGNLYPNGLEIHPQDDLEDLIERHDATTCAFAYSDTSYEALQSLASRANAAGCKFVQLPPHLTMVPSRNRPVVSVCASRTGVGKSQTTRYVADFFKNRLGLKVAVARHPMPYDPDLNRQRIQRYEKEEDMDKYDCTIEEREEYFRHIEDGNLLFAGVDYPLILQEAEKDADIVLWDGGNNDLPFFKPDLHICLVDALRPRDEERYYPGETNLRMADMVLITKVNMLPDIQQAHDYAEHLKTIVKPNTPIIYGESVIVPEAKNPQTGEPLSTEEAAALVRGKRVLVIDDGPTLTHGGMSFGAGYAMAQELGAAEIVDPRPYAEGSLAATFEKFKHLHNVLPAMGYGEEQMRDLEATIRATPCDTIVLGTPSDMTHLMELDKPSVIARYNLKIVPEHAEQFDEVLRSYFDRFHAHHQQPPKAA